MQQPPSRPDSSDTPLQHLRKDSSSLDMPAQILQRKGSRSSISGSSLIPPPQLVPEPAYIASSAASQIVNSEYVSRGPNWVDEEGKDDGLGVSPAALVMVNAFLDQLLFSFLKGARSTSIIALKPAINDILKPRLAKDAIQGADEELQGYLSGGDDEELNDFHNGQELSGERNLQRIFRRTRLRCMVYTRLGDMEEEDEDIYLESEAAQDPDERHRLSNDLGNVSPAAAIFLTSIIEFIGEQALMIAGEAAYNRLGMKKPVAEERRAAVEESDVEKLAFNTTLGRLWRSWKNRTRPTSMSSARPTSRDYQGRKSSLSRSEMTSRATSVGEADESVYLDGNTQRPKRSVAEILHEDPANIPLPQSRGLPEEPDFGTDTEAPDVYSMDQGRRRSMFEYQAARESGMFTQLHAMGMMDPQDRPARPEHRRSSSMPLYKTPFTSLRSDKSVPPSEIPDRFIDSNDQVASEADIPKVGNESQTVSKLAIGNPNVETMYDGVLGSERESTAAHTGNTREVSMISNYSNAATDGSYDHDMTPQALNFKKSDKHSLAPTEESHPDSHASTISDEYSFGNGDAPTGIFGPPAAKKEIRTADGILPNRADARVPDVESETTGSSKNFASLATVQGDRLRTYDESGKAVKRDIPVLYESPSNQDVIYNPKAPTTNLRDEPSMLTPPKPLPQGVPPLTPLRELRDAAHDTSDEGSSVAASYDHEGPRSDEFPAQPFKGVGGQRGASYSSTPNAQITEQPTMAASKLVDMRSQPLPINPGSERAAVQRVSPSGSNRDAVSPFGRTSTSSNRDTKPLTTGSSGAKLHKIITRESTESGRQPMPRRSSSGQSDGLRNSHRAGSGSQSGNKELDFESLIRSDETLQYTLTPQNMREMEVMRPTLPPNMNRSTNSCQSPNSPRWSQRADMGEPATITRTRSTDQAISPSSSSPKSSKGFNGLRANPATTPNGSSNVMEFVPPPPKPLSSKVPGSVPKSPGGSVPKSPGGKQVAPRDATIQSDSLMRDFADFIRSTGPDTDSKNMYKSSPVGGDQHSRNTSTNSQAVNTGKPLPKKITKQTPVIAPKQPESKKPTPQRSSSKLKAREPVIATNSTTADLADFLRSGPPGAHVDAARQSQKQSPTGVNGISNGRMVSTGSFASTQDSFPASKITQSSTNSRTGLLENRGGPVKNVQQQKDFPPDVGGPVRKQRRIKDPYALDSDDEDAYSAPPPPEREEESLSDFLRNYTPPPEAPTTRNNALGVGQPPPTAKDRRASGATMRERLARNIAVPPKAPKKNSTVKTPSSLDSHKKRQNAALPPKPPSQLQNSNPSTPSPTSQLGRSRPQVPTSNSPNSAPQLPPLNPRATSPHLISQNGSKMDSYKPTRPTYAAHVDRAARPKPQARDEVGVSTIATGGGGGGGMGDLAEFLRDTEPPAPTRPVMMGNSAKAMSMSPEPKSRGGGGFGGMFGRKRKV